MDMMSFVYYGYSELTQGKLIHLKQFLEAARLRDAGFENVRRLECLDFWGLRNPHLFNLFRVQICNIINFFDIQTKPRPLHHWKKTMSLAGGVVEG